MGRVRLHRHKALCLALVLIGLPALPACIDSVEEAQTKWATLESWTKQQIEVAEYRIAREGLESGSAVVRIYRSNEDLVRFGEGFDETRREVFRYNLSQTAPGPAGLDSQVRLHNSFWLDANTLRLRVGSQSAQAWNGNIFKEIRVVGDEARLFIHSHLNGRFQSKASFPREAIPDLLLPFYVRAVLSRVDEVSALPVLTLGSVWLSNEKPKIVSTTLSLVAEEPYALPNGVRTARRVDARNEDGRRSFWVSAEPPHELLAWEGPEGALFELVSHRWVGWPGAD